MPPNLPKVLMHLLMAMHTNESICACDNQRNNNKGAIYNARKESVIFLFIIIQQWLVLTTAAW